tara:strand:+ start:9282 stop:9845 length:564 start_codon:yes stop_codon:yes gene_type:complete
MHFPHRDKERTIKMKQRKLINKRRLNNKKLTCKKHLLPMDENQGSKETFQTTTALDLLAQVGILNEDCVLAGNQYALIKYKRPIGGPSEITSNLDAQLAATKSKEKKLWQDTIVNDGLEGIWRESQKVTNRISSVFLEKIIIDNCLKTASTLIDNKEQAQKLKKTLSMLSVIYKHHQSTNLLLNEIT